jgi:hypothetical protein
VAVAQSSGTSGKSLTGFPPRDRGDVDSDRRGYFALGEVGSDADHPAEAVLRGLPGVGDGDEVIVFHTVI